jgi:O-antigen/teichoic acid export membrane protein
MLEKLKSLSKQTLIYGTSTIIGRFLNFILVPFYTNIFPPSEYGIVSVVFAYIAFLNIFYTLGFESGYFRFASLGELGDEKLNFSLPYNTIAVNSAFLSILILIFSSQINSLAGFKENNVEIVRYASLILFFDALSIIPFAYLRLKNKAGKFAAIKLINVSVNVTLNIVLIMVFKMGLVAVFISNLAASCLTFIILLPIVINNYTIHGHKELFKELVKFSLPYLPAGLSAIIVQVIYIPIIQALTDIQSVGIYNANYKMGIFMLLVVSMFDYAWRPFFLNSAKEPNAKQLFSKVLTYFVAASSILIIILTLFIEDIIRIPLPFKGFLIGQKYWGGVYIVPVILLSYLFYGIYINLMPGIYIEKKTKYLPYITGFAGILNIAVCFIFIPLWGLIGAAIATLLSYISMAVSIYFVTQKFYPIKYETPKVLYVIFIDVLCIGVFYLMFTHIVPATLFLKIISLLIFSGFILAVSGLWKVKKLFVTSKVHSRESGNV